MDTSIVSLGSTRVAACLASLAIAAGVHAADSKSGAAIIMDGSPALPEGYNFWVASSAGLASDDFNWSAGHSPKDSENVLFDGRFSTADCEWNSAASATVAQACWISAELRMISAGSRGSSSSLHGCGWEGGAKLFWNSAGTSFIADTSFKGAWRWDGLIIPLFRLNLALRIKSIS